MKQLALLFILLGSALSAQTSSTVDHHGFERSSNLCSLNQKIYYLTRTFQPGACCNDSMSFICRDLNGNQLFRTHFTHAPWLNKFYITRTGNQFVLYAESDMTECDTGYSLVFLAGADTTGAITWTLNTRRNIVGFTPSTSNNFRMWTNDSVFDFTTGLQLFAAQAHSLPSLYSVASYTAGSTVVCYGASSGPILRVLNSNYQNVLSAPVIAPLRGLQVSADNGILGIANNQVYKYSSNLGLLHSLTPPSFTVKGILTRNDSVFAAGENSQGTANFLLADSSLAIKHVSTSQYEHAECTGLAATGGKVRLMCTFTHGHFWRVHAGVMNTSISGNFNAKENIELKTLMPVVTQLIPYFGFYNVVLDINFKIVNHGINTLTSFKLNSQSTRGGIEYCFFGLNRKFNVNILPGDSATISTGTFLAYQGPVSLIPPNICFYTSGPNGEVDDDFSNDELCTVLNLPLSVNEGQIDNEISVEPVPAQDVISLRSQVVMNTVNIFDFAGRKVLTLESNSNDVDIDISDVLPGVYFLTVKTANSVYTSKIIVQH